MPKISAATVAEHRAAQRAALLTATERLLEEGGLAGVTPRSVAERAGLARSSFYEYFASRDDALTAVAIAAFERWSAEIDETLSGVPATARLRAYIEATMRMTADGKHGIAATLQQAELSPSRHEDIMAMHTALLDPIAGLLREAGVRDADSHAVLLQGLLNAGVQLVTHGVSPDATSAMITDLLEKGLPADSSI
ncbi:TetR/AcrR family transcriptional regulator [Leifsonia sp. NPDC080035]|uniref:TetR/AcrR family transcriptional regulator n=1 Tax=Leifsonia sp. NPDC080035 TaxID=3143936 RepID=A0AAU7GHV8_9MICO